MFKSLIATLLLILSLTLSSCSVGTSGLQSYVSGSQGYQFLYPNGWIQVDVKDASEGVDVVFRDLIQRTENLSAIVSDVPQGKQLEDLGTPTDVGYRFLKQINARSKDNRQIELINAQSREIDGKTYYKLEYQVQLPDDRTRHDLASVVISRGKLFTFNLSTTQERWEKVKDVFEVVVNSFSVS